MSKTDTEGSGLSRDAVISAALDLVDREGVVGLSMRALADRLGVRAASLYWHVRDKEQLLESLAATVLDGITVPPTPPEWRPRVTAACEALATRLQRHPAAASLILRCPPAVLRSRLTRELAAVLAGTGLVGAEDAARSLVFEVVAAISMASIAPVRPRSDQAMQLSIESGSWRVAVRGGGPGMVDVATAADGGSGGPFLEIRSDGRVLVRNWRGGNRGAVELSPAYEWFIKVHSGAANVALDLASVRLRGLDFDSGTGNITCQLPAPVGIVPVRVNSGIVGVTMHRPVGTEVQALVHSGTLRIRFDDQPIRATRADVRWQTAGATSAADCYQVTVNSGCVKVVMDATAPSGAVPRSPSPEPTAQDRAGDALSGVGLLLDGVERRLSA
ncbi:MAG: TetR/AcrR family transcriptional regulator [Candidatus Dormibacteria bacterium]